MSDVKSVFFNAISVQIDKNGDIVGTINKERMLEQFEVLEADSVGCIRFKAQKRKDPHPKGHTHCQPLALLKWQQRKDTHNDNRKDTPHNNTTHNGHSDQYSPVTIKQFPEDERF